MGTIDLEQRETTFVGATWRERRKGGPGTAIAGRERASEGRSTFLIFFFFFHLGPFFPSPFVLASIEVWADDTEC